MEYVCGKCRKFIKDKDAVTISGYSYGGSMVFCVKCAMKEEMSE